MPDNREREIEDAVIAHPEALGFPGARSIRNARVVACPGRVDVMLFPNSGPTRLALVEAKCSEAPDSASKVLGQLLMYYAGALELSDRGLHVLRWYAETQVERALGFGWISPMQMTGGVSPPPAAWEVLQSDRKLLPSELKLFIALDAQPRESLIDVVTTLRQYLQLDVGLVVVENRVPRLLCSAPGARDVEVIDGRLESRVD